MGGSALLVLAAFQTMSGLQSLETTRGIESTLADPPLDGAGLGVEAVRRAMHVAALVLGGCAVATAILGYQVLRRDRAARVALTALAGPLVVAGISTDPFMTPIVGGAIGMLWARPAREWFRGADDPG